MTYDGIVSIHRHVTGAPTDATLDAWVDVNSIRITGGRSTVTEQPAPTVATFTVISQPGENPVPLQLNEKIRIMSFGTIDATYGTCWFIGRVTDSNVTVQNWYSGTGVVSTTYTAVSELATLNRRQVGGSGYSKQYDSDRIRAILTDSGVSNAQVPIGQTYEIAVYSGGETDALGLAQEAAKSAKGVLYDKCYLSSGYYFSDVFYDSSTVRQSNPSYTLTQDEINALGLTLSGSMTECATQVKVTNYAGAGTTYTASASILNYYGYQSGTRQTTLHNSTDANTIGQELLAAKSVPKYRVDSITLNLASPAISSTTFTILTPPALGTRLSFTLPDPLNNANLIPVTYDGFIEGYSLDFARGQIQVTLNLSNFGDLYPYTYWNTAATATDTWQTAYSAVETWEGVI